MKACVLLGSFLLLAFTVFGQTTDKSLRHKYSQAADGSFIVKPGVTIKAVYGDNHQACVLTIAGPISEKELVKIFEKAVPESRGSKTQDLLECMGACTRVIEFENVSYRSAVVGTQTADPDAVIIFGRKDCEPAADEAKKITFSIKRKN